MVGEGVRLLHLPPLGGRPDCPAPFFPFFFGAGLGTGFAVGFGCGFMFFAGSLPFRVRVFLAPRPIILSWPIHSSCLRNGGWTEMSEIRHVKKRGGLFYLRNSSLRYLL